MSELDDVAGRQGYQKVKRVAPEIEWCDPPPEQFHADHIDWYSVAAVLRTRRFRWARITMADRTLGPIAARIQGSNAVAPFRPVGSFEAVVRDNQLYARYVGQDIYGGPGE